MNDVPSWISRHRLSVGATYCTDDSDLVVQYLGHAPVRDRNGFQYVMVFREVGPERALLTLVEADADACAGFTPLGDQIVDELRPPPGG